MFLRACRLELVGANSGHPAARFEEGCKDILSQPPPACSHIGHFSRLLRALPRAPQPPSASALFAASRSSRFDMYDWRPRSRHLSHFEGCFAYFVAHFRSFSLKKWACKNFLQPLHHLKCCWVFT